MQASAWKPALWGFVARDNNSQQPCEGRAPELCFVGGPASRLASRVVPCMGFLDVYGANAVDSSFVSAHNSCMMKPW